MTPTYAERKAARLCTDCMAGLQETDGTRCLECATLGAADARRYRAKNKRKTAAITRKYRLANLARAAALAKKWRVSSARLERCDDCSADAVSGSTFCAKHRARRRLRAREYQRRKRAERMAV
jgi:hypothetical protein